MSNLMDRSEVSESLDVMYGAFARVREQVDAQLKGGKNDATSTTRNNFRTVYSGGKNVAGGGASASANELEVEDLELNGLDESLQATHKAESEVIYRGSGVNVLGSEADPEGDEKTRDRESARKRS